MFNNWSYDDYVEQFNSDKGVRFIEPMSSHEVDIFKHTPSDTEFAELKYDGHRGLLFFGEENRAFSRRVSKKSGWYSENTDCVPHIRDLRFPKLHGTVIDGEFDYGNNSMGVQSVLGSLPERAIEFQEENGYIPFKAFDILYYKGINVQKLPLWKRKIYLAKVINDVLDSGGDEASKYFIYAEMYMLDAPRFIFYKLITDYTGEDEEIQEFIRSRIIVVDDFISLFDKFVDEEKEGIMIKDMYGIYEQKRSKAYLKVKGVSTWDCVVMGYEKPTKVYDGKEILKWKYWEVDGELMELEGFHEAEHYGHMQGIDVIPVTKPYFMGWCGAISFGVYRGARLVKVGDCKGLKEEVQQDIKINGDKYIGRVIEVRANGILDVVKGSLRHPRFSSWRDDKNSEQCVWQDHIRKL